MAYSSPKLSAFLVFLAALLLAAWLVMGPSLALAGETDCAEKFSQLSTRQAFDKWWEETRKYWAHEKSLASFTADEIPAWSFYTYLKHGTKLVIAPTSLALDIPAAYLRLGRNINGISTMEKLVLLPLELTQRNGAHMLGYTGLSIAGFSAINATMNQTFVEDFEAEMPKTVDLGEKELAVFVTPSGDPEIPKQFYQGIIDAYKSRGYGDEKIKLITAESRAGLFKALADLRAQGKIKYLYLTAHGAPGNLNFEAGANLKDDRFPSAAGAVSEESISEETLKNPLPDDLFAGGAKIAIYSCNFAAGESGEKTLKLLGTTFLQNGGAIIGSEKLVKVPLVSRLEFLDLLYYRNSPDADLPEKAYNLALNHVLINPKAVLAAIPLIATHPIDALGKGPKVRKIEIPKQDKK